MRILLANDGFGDAGGVQNYLDAVAGGLAARGHALALLHRDATPAPFAGRATQRAAAVQHRGGRHRAALDRVAALGAGRLLLAQHERARHRPRAHRAVAGRQVHARLFRHLHRRPEAVRVSGRPAVRPPVRRRLPGALWAAPLRRAEAGRVRRPLPLGARAARPAAAVSHHRRRQRAHEARVRPQRRPAVADSGQPAVSDAHRTSRPVAPVDGVGLPLADDGRSRLSGG